MKLSSCISKVYQLIEESRSIKSYYNFLSYASTYGSSRKKRTYLYIIVNSLRGGELR